MIINGDCLEELKKLPDASVQMCVTSPPYYGLRDYGTATWEGGDEGCAHNPQKPDGGERADRALPLGRGGVFRDICGKCGAVRIDDQIGLEETPEVYVEKLVAVFREVRRVLKDDGVLWLNLGDSYASSWGSCRPNKIGNPSRTERQIKMGVGTKEKDLIGIPWMVAFALRADGWWLRQDIIWHKPNPMPESVKDRCTKSHEYIFLLSKNARYYFDAEAIKEDASTPPGIRNSFNIDKSRMDAGYDGHRTRTGLSRNGIEDTGYRNRRSVWTVTTKPYPEAHFATFPPDLIEPCIKAGTSARGECPRCGKAWVRIVERQVGTSNPCPKEQAAHEARGGTGNHKGTVGRSGGSRIDGFTTTVGWEPQCDCGLDPVPQTVLDPFGGSGTTAEVCILQKRKYILIELNPEYCALAEKRVLSTPVPLFA